MSLVVKICGLRDIEAVAAAVAGGAGFLGVVFFEKSPRNIAPDQAAEILQFVPETIVKTGLFVDPDDDRLRDVLTRVRLDLVQLHGTETPDRVEDIRQTWGLPVMKAIAVGEPADLLAARAYERVADRLLFDAKPPKGATRPGGNALAFDWAILKDAQWAVPWMLAGGITADNLAVAVATSGARAVDVSSGVERAPGHKDPALIAAFLECAGKL